MPQKRSHRGWRIAFVGCVSAIARIACILGTPLTLATGSAAEQRYVELSAEIETITYLPSSNDGASNAVGRKISLICTTSTNEWRIESDFARGAEVKWLFDGTNVYSTTHPTEAPAQDGKDRLAWTGLAVAPFAVAASNVTMTVATTPGGHPLGNAGVNIPWLAFCSGTYLRRGDCVIPLPVATLRHAPDGFAYRANAETFKDELGLPMRVDLYTSKDLSTASVKMEHLFSGRQANSPGPDVPDGILKFHYVVTETTNFLEWHLPLRLEYVQYEAAADGHWAPRYAGVGRVKAVRRAGKPASLFAPSMQQTVVDYRFRDTNKFLHALTYQSTNDFVAPPNDPALQASFAAKLRLAPPPRLENSSRVRIAIGCVLFLTTVLIVFLTCGRRVCRRNPNSATNQHL